jgi:hypothetical protein
VETSWKKFARFFQHARSRSRFLCSAYSLPFFRWKTADSLKLFDDSLQTRLFSDRLVVASFLL